MLTRIEKMIDHTMLTLVLLGLAFVAGRVSEQLGEPKPIVVKLELPVAIDGEAFGDRPSLDASMPDPAAVDLAHRFGGGMWSCPPRQ